MDTLIRRVCFLGSGQEVENEIIFASSVHPRTLE